MSSGFQIASGSKMQEHQMLAGAMLISTSGFVNRRSGVQSPHPAPHKTAYFRRFSPVLAPGSGGMDGASQRFIPPRKPEQLFPVSPSPYDSPSGLKRPVVRSTTHIPDPHGPTRLACHARRSAAFVDYRHLLTGPVVSTPAIEQGDA